MVERRRLSRYRSFSGHVLDLAQRHAFPAFLTVDIDATAMLACKRRHGLARGFRYTLLAKCIAELIHERPEMRVLNSVMRRTIFGAWLLTCEAVHFSLALAKDLDGEPAVAIAVLKDAHAKTIAEIDADVRQAIATPMERMPVTRRLRAFLRLPSPLQRLLLGAISYLQVLRPSLVTDFGTIGMTDMGGLPIRTISGLSPKTLFLGIGGIQRRPWNAGGRLELRDALTLSLTINHYAVDGRLAGEFLAALKEKLEGLDARGG